MPKGTNQKFKLYRLAQIMLEQTDDEHYITMPEIKEALARYDITADRKSIYADLRDLEVLGIEVEGEPVGKSYHYHVVSRAAGAEASGGRDPVVEIHYREKDERPDPEAGEAGQQIRGHEAAAAGLCIRPDQDDEREHLLYSGRHPQCDLGE